MTCSFIIPNAIEIKIFFYQVHIECVEFNVIPISPIAGYTFCKGECLLTDCNFTTVGLATHIDGNV